MLSLSDMNSQESNMVFWVFWKSKNTCHPDDIYQSEYRCFALANTLTPSWEKSLPVPLAFQMEGAGLGRGEGSSVVLVNSSTLPAVWRSFNIVSFKNKNIFHYLQMFTFFSKLTLPENARQDQSCVTQMSTNWTFAFPLWGSLLTLSTFTISSHRPWG